MIQSGLKRAHLGVVAALLAFTGCADNNPYGVPYYENGYLLAGIYVPAVEGAASGFRLVLGSRHTVTGRYEGPNGEFVRFEGAWERNAGRVTVTLDAAAGVPSTIEFTFNRETVLIPIASAPGPRDEDAPDTSQQFIERDVMRLLGGATVAGETVTLNLTRTITEVVTIGGGDAA